MFVLEPVLVPYGRVDAHATLQPMGRHPSIQNASNAPPILGTGMVQTNIGGSMIMANPQYSSNTGNTRVYQYIILVPTHSSYSLEYRYAIFNTGSCYRYFNIIIDSVKYEICNIEICFFFSIHAIYNIAISQYAYLGSMHPQLVLFFKILIILFFYFIHNS